jgi:hypothetical protein
MIAERDHHLPGDGLPVPAARPVQVWGEVENWLVL